MKINRIKLLVSTLALLIPAITFADMMTPTCPTRVTLEQIKEFRENESKVVDIPGFDKKVTMSVTKGLGDVHTKLPISSRKFEESIRLKGTPTKNPDGSFVCKYEYDKTLGRKGALELKIEDVK